LSLQTVGIWASSREIVADDNRVGVLKLNPFKSPAANANRGWRKFVRKFAGWLKTEISAACHAYTRRKAEQGDAAAQFRLGVACDNGDRQPKAPDLALKWYRKAAYQGHANAQYALGMGYVRGQGVAVDATEGMLWLQKAAAQGHTYAQFALGQMYCGSEGTARDIGQAAKWFRKAGDKGHTEAKISLKQLFADDRQSLVSPSPEQDTAQDQKLAA
jgi:TPR repeat protein